KVVKLHVGLAQEHRVEQNQGCEKFECRQPGARGDQVAPAGKLAKSRSNVAPRIEAQDAPWLRSADGTQSEAGNSPQAADAQKRQAENDGRIAPLRQHESAEGGSGDHGNIAGQLE